MNGRKIKKKLMIPIFLILIMLVALLVGCYDHVEIESWGYEGQDFVLDGSAPTLDSSYRELDESKLEFRFYNTRFANWDNEYHTVKGVKKHTENNRCYFFAKIDGLEDNTLYPVRALGYYYDVQFGEGWGYSTVASFRPSDLCSSTETIQINQINNIGNIKIGQLLELLEKNPILKEIVCDRYLGISIGS